MKILKVVQLITLISTFCLVAFTSTAQSSNKDHLAKSYMPNSRAAPMILDAGDALVNYNAVLNAPWYTVSVKEGGKPFMSDEIKDTPLVQNPKSRIKVLMDVEGNEVYKPTSMFFDRKNRDIESYLTSSIYLTDKARATLEELRPLFLGFKDKYEGRFYGKDATTLEDYLCISYMGPIVTKTSEKIGDVVVPSGYFIVVRLEHPPEIRQKYSEPEYPPNYPPELRKKFPEPELRPTGGKIILVTQSGKWCAATKKDLDELTGITIFPTYIEKSGSSFRGKVISTKKYTGSLGGGIGSPYYPTPNKDNKETLEAILYELQKTPLPHPGANYKAKWGGVASEKPKLTPKSNIDLKLYIPKSQGAQALASENAFVGYTSSYNLPLYTISVKGIGTAYDSGESSTTLTRSPQLRSKGTKIVEIGDIYKATPIFLDRANRDCEGHISSSLLLTKEARDVLDDLRFYFHEYRELSTNPEFGVKPNLLGSEDEWVYTKEVFSLEDRNCITYVGPIITKTSQKVEGTVVPSGYFVLICTKEGDLDKKNIEGLGEFNFVPIIVTQTGKWCVTTVAHIEQLTGITFFPKYKDQGKNSVKAEMAFLKARRGRHIVRGEGGLSAFIRALSEGDTRVDVVYELENLSLPHPGEGYAGSWRAPLDIPKEKMEALKSNIEDRLMLPKEVLGAESTSKYAENWERKQLERVAGMFDYTPSGERLLPRARLLIHQSSFMVEVQKRKAAR